MLRRPPWNLKPEIFYIYDIFIDNISIIPTSQRYWSGKKYTPFPIWSLLTLMLAFFSLSCLIIPCFWTPGRSISITLPVLFVVCARALMRHLFTFSASVVWQLTCGTNWHYFLPPISISTPSRLRVLCLVFLKIIMTHKLKIIFSCFLNYVYTKIEQILLIYTP